MLKLLKNNYKCWEKKRESRKSKSWPEIKFLNKKIIFWSTKLHLSWVLSLMIRIHKMNKIFKTFYIKSIEMFRQMKIFDMLGHLSKLRIKEQQRDSSLDVYHCKILRFWMRRTCNKLGKSIRRYCNRIKMKRLS